jgi:hypothetical protein
MLASKSVIHGRMITLKQSKMRAGILVFHKEKMQVGENWRICQSRMAGIHGSFERAQICHFREHLKVAGKTGV